MKRKISESKSFNIYNFSNSSSNNSNNTLVQYQEDLDNVTTGSKKLNQGKEEAIKTFCRIKPIENNPYTFKISETDNKVLIYNSEESVTNNMSSNISAVDNTEVKSSNNAWVRV